ncbi:conserved protein of unknown function [Candidatus Filomicrobium marinum]|uniref:Uncharacterized protein n=2 Tax=Filomicrobium TaxID=119044 RepID=A0A0D6JBL1_9HYPH|nr:MULTISPECIES: hypothetical protein [Filomicrobium]MCV0371050.1 hypothetical protein [Filomicrobium sp.]CFX03415.1 conserved protein of unknown function [Candidatus Filomicrobium marinum]CPR15846.1 conserved protein of unknown function [Candidatus Filomicrobium marinum]SDP41738.1 hypothetical protein SAMN04488061_2918 [Filomicrobium insigne]
MAHVHPVGVIEVRVNEISQLFDTLDPLPFRDRDLDPHAEEYIVGWAREFPRRRAFTIIVHAPKHELGNKYAQQLEAALRSYFNYRADVVEGELKELFKVGRKSLLIGMAVLATCTVAAQAIPEIVGPGSISRFFGEGLVILGWVANWKPMEIFLYEWWPLGRRRDLYRRLGQACVEVKAFDA